MEFAASRGGDAGAGTTAGGGCESSVCVEAVDVSALSDEALRCRIGGIGRAESRLAAFKSEALAEMASRHNPVTAERVAREELQSSKRTARHDVKAAERLARLTAASEALAAGEIPQDHARLIARASSEGPIDEGALVEAARSEDYDTFSKTVRRQQQDLSGDDGQAILDRQHQKRTARMFNSRETGMFVMAGEFDPVTGSHIAAVMAAKERELWRQEDPRARRTPQQRAADALSELILKPEKGSARGIALVLVADYDATQRELVNARLSDGTPLPIEELVRLACDADIFPSVFNAKTQDLWLGRRRRTASDAQRIALMVRDKHCVGCGADASRSFAHHIKHWRNNGLTDYPNLVLVCNDCHHDIHERDYQVIYDPGTRKHRVEPPPEPFPESGANSYRPSQANPVLRN